MGRGRVVTYLELLESARAAVASRGEVDPDEALKRALRRDPRRLIDGSARKPRFVVWELTRACNMRCRHCGSRAGRVAGDELSPDEALRLADELGELGCERVTLLGGEPLMRPDWVDIARRLRRGRVRVNMISNGWLVADPKTLEAIDAAQLVNVGLSIDGLERTHDTLRQRPGSFKRLLEAADALVKRGVKVNAVTVVTPRSLEELDELHRVVVDAGVALWQIQLAVPRGRLERESPDVPRPSDLMRLAEKLVELRTAGEVRVDVSDNIGYFGGYETPLRRTAADQIPFWTGCYAGVKVLGIDPNGDVKGCASLPSTETFIEGNVKRTPLREIWERPDAFAYNRRFELDELDEPCRSCEHAPLCRGGCRSAALGYTGSIRSTTMCLHQLSPHRLA